MQNIGKIISIFIGILYCLFIVWNRLIRERLPRNIFVDYNNYIICIYFLLFFTSIYIVIYSLKEIFKIYSKYRILNKLLENPKIEKIFRIAADIVINYILKGPKNLFEYLYKKIKIKLIIDNICNFIIRNDLAEKKLFLYLLLIFRYSSNIVLVFIFLYDIFYLKNIKNFFIFLYLLLIPLCIDLILFIIYYLAKKNRGIIKEWITFIPNEKKDGFNMILNINNKENPLLNFNEEDRINSLQYHGSYYYTYTYSNMAIDNYYKIEKKYKPYIYIIIYSIYTCGWGYILINILF